MDMKRSTEIAWLMLMADAFERVPTIARVPQDPVAGELALEMVQHRALKKNLRFNDIRADMGRLSDRIKVPQDELHEFLITQIFPFLIAEGLTASGQINFEWSGRRG